MIASGRMRVLWRRFWSPALPRMTQGQRIVRIMLPVFAWTLVAAVAAGVLGVDGSEGAVLVGSLPWFYAWHLLDLHQELYGKDEHPRRY